MSDRERVTLDPAFEFTVPSGWIAERDEEEGISVFAAEGVGLLHLVAFPQGPGEMPDPAEELYAFLEDQEIELQEDEIEDLELAGGGELALCEYLTEEEDEEEEESATYWMIGVAVAPGSLVLSSYSCPSDAAEAERQAIREILLSLRLHETPEP